jgi:hypothetical protein
MEEGREAAIGIKVINQELLVFGEIVSTKRNNIGMLQSSH